MFYNHPQLQKQGHLGAVKNHTGDKHLWRIVGFFPTADRERLMDGKTGQGRAFNRLRRGGSEEGPST